MRIDADDTLEKLVKELETSVNKKLEDWKSLKEDMKKRKLSEYEQRMAQVSVDEAARVLAIVKKLEERFGYGQMFSDVGTTGGSPVQFERILELSKTEGDICGMLDALADAGYTLNEYKDKNQDKIMIRYLAEKDVALFKRLLKDDLYKRFSETFKTLKKTLNYDNRACSSSNNYSEIENLIKLTKTEGDVVGAVCLLAETGYRMNKEIGLTENHVEMIEYVTRTILKENEDGISFLYLYKKLKPELFKEYFSNINLEKKKKVLEKIFESDYHNNEVIRWLEESYHDLLRETSFKD